MALKPLPLKSINLNNTLMDNLKYLEALAKPLTGAGSPYDIITPSFVGQTYVDTETGFKYDSKALHPKAWELISKELVEDLNKVGIVSYDNATPPTETWSIISGNTLPSTIVDGEYELDGLVYLSISGGASESLVANLVGVGENYPDSLYVIINGVEVELPKTGETDKTQYNLPFGSGSVPSEISDVFKNNVGEYINFIVDVEPDAKLFIINNAHFFYDFTDPSTMTLEAGNLVSSVNDLTSNGINLSQPTSSEQPIFNDALGFIDFQDASISKLLIQDQYTLQPSHELFWKGEVSSTGRAGSSVFSSVGNNLFETNATDAIFTEDDSTGNVNELRFFNRVQPSAQRVINAFIDSVSVNAEAFIDGVDDTDLRDLEINSPLVIDNVIGNPSPPNGNKMKAIILFNRVLLSSERELVVNYLNSL